MARGGGAVVLLLALAAGAAGCGGPEKNLEESREALRSWTATVDALDAGWRGRLLPRAFAKTALDAGDREVGKEIRRLGKTAKKLPAARAEAAAAASLRRRIASLRGAVERGERAPGGSGR